MQLKPNTLLQGGKYRIIRALGQGGFGITYEAEHTVLGELVAVKEFFMKDVCNREEGSSTVSVPSLGSQALVGKFKSKFIKEARTIWRLNHPNIVKIHDVFEENGTAYYVMENLPGGSLKQKVETDGPLSEQESIVFIRQVADALAYIHSRNTVHLDIKPSNILLNADGDAILIDFGISKHYDSSGEQTSSTPVGLSKGFAPLEQGRDGDVSQFGPATDIYALGATLYYLLTGHIPPEASIVYEDGLSRPEGISDKVWCVIEQSMQPRRKDRPQSIVEFLALLGKEEPAPMSPLIVEPVLDSEDEKTIVDVEILSKPDDDNWVDLGLPSGLRWATCNLGASSPEEYGDFCAWGEIETKKDFRWRTYALQNRIGLFGDAKSFSKYSASVDGLFVLKPEDDAATVKMGKGCRIPTIEEWEELIQYCTCEWKDLNGHYGIHIVSSLNGKSIFLPAAGYRDANSQHYAGSYGVYWSSSLDPEFSDNAWSLYFYRDEVTWYRGMRYVGLCIRPVAD